MQSVLSRGEWLGAAAVAELLSQLTHAGPLLTVVHSLLDASDPFRREHEGRQLTEFCRESPTPDRAVENRPGRSHTCGCSVARL